MDADAAVLGADARPMQPVRSRIEVDASRVLPADGGAVDPHSRRPRRKDDAAETAEVVASEPIWRAVL